MRIWGQFRDLNDENHFVWVRGYRSMEDRKAGLSRFYFSSMWQETSPEILKMLVPGTSRVRLLEPATEEGFGKGHKRPALVSEISEGESRGIVVAQVFLAGEGDAAAPAEEVERALGTAAATAGGQSLGLFLSSGEPNNFPLLPYIEGEAAVVWFGSFPDRETLERVL